MNETKFYNEFCIKYDLDPANLSVDTIIRLLGKYKEALDGVAMEELWRENQSLKKQLDEANRRRISK